MKAASKTKKPAEVSEKGRGHGKNAYDTVNVRVLIISMAKLLLRRKTKSSTSTIF